ncbi:MAG: SH3 domain-containing protein [Actinomycetota bacterium]
MKSCLSAALIAVLALVASACSTGGDDPLDDAGRAETSSAADNAVEASGEADDGSDADTTDEATDNDAEAADEADDGDTSDDTTATTVTTTAPPGEDGRLVWTVVGVEFDDTLNVRAEPNTGASVVAELDPWTTGLTATGETSDAAATWREIALGDGTTGWVNSRFVVGQPAELDAATAAELAVLGERFVAWAEGGPGAPDDFLAPRSLWVSGIAVYADLASEWNWVPADELDAPAEWDAQRNFIIDQSLDCGNEACSLSMREFLNLDRIDGTTEVLINDIPADNEAHLEGLLWRAPRSMHRVVVNTPSSDPDEFFDWQRLHLVPDWSSGEPRFHLMHNHGWTP